MRLTVCAAALIAAGALTACNDRTGASSPSASGGTGGASASATSGDASAQQSAAAAGNTVPAHCQVDPAFAARIPALPASASANTDQTDYQALTADDDLLPNGARYDVIEIGAEPNQRLRMRITGQGFTPRLILYGPDRCPLSETEAVSGGALLDERLGAAGEYRVLVTSTRPGLTGAYTGDVELQTETPLT